MPLDIPNEDVYHGVNLTLSFMFKRELRTCKPGIYVPARPEPTIPHKKQVDQKPFAKNHNPKHPNETEKLAITTIHFGSYLSVKPTYTGVSKR